MNCDPQVMRFIGGGPWTSPVEEFREQFRAALARNADKPWGGAIVADRSTGRFLGLCWLAPGEFLGGQIELGYRLVPSAWGRGLATEAARGIVRVGFDELALKAIGSACHGDNVASIRVLAKLGFEPCGERFHSQCGCNVTLYTLSRDRWVQQQP